jgi:hypothetical protein
MATDPWAYAERGGNEHSHQTALFMWANMAFRFGLTAADNVESYTVSGAANIVLHRHNDRVELLEWLHAIHNQGRTPGEGGKIRGALARAEGVKAGVFDVFLPVPRMLPTMKAGLYVELKKPDGGRVSGEQKLFHEYATRMGYAAEYAAGWLAARKIILDYLGIGG